MKDFLRIFAADTKKLFYSKLVYAFLGLCLAFTIFVFIFSIVSEDMQNDDYAQKSTYGVTKYDTQQQLQTLSQNAKTYYQSMVDKLNEDILLGDVSEDLEFRQTTIDNAHKVMLVYEYLENNNISYNNYNDFGFAQYCNTFIRSEILNFYSLMYIITIAIGIVTLIRAAILIPSEISSGKYKFMFVVPLSRFKYILYRFLFLLLQSALFLVIYCVFIMLAELIIFGGNDVLIFATKNYAFGLGYIPAVLFILLFFLFNIFSLTLFAFCISLLVSNVILSLVVTFFIYFGKDIIIGFINIVWFLITKNNLPLKTIYKYYFIENIFPLNAYADNIYNTPLWLAIVITLVYLILLSIAASLKFIKQDIKK